MKYYKEIIIGLIVICAIGILVAKMSNSKVEKIPVFERTVNEPQFQTPGE